MIQGTGTPKFEVSSKPNQPAEYPFENLASQRSVAITVADIQRSVAITVADIQMERTHLDLSNRQNLTSEKIVEIIKAHPNLESLDLSGNNNVDNDVLAAIANCPNLHTLNLNYCSGVTDVSALAGCANLHTLILNACSGVTDVSALAGCANLHSLNLSHCKGVTDVSALAGFTNLHTLKLYNCIGVTDVSALAGCKNLKM